MFFEFFKNKLNFKFGVYYLNMWRFLFQKIRTIKVNLRGMKISFVENVFYHFIQNKNLKLKGKEKIASIKEV